MSEIHCPECDASEMHPTQTLLVVRVNKVHVNGHWHSQCLRCSGLWNEDLTRYNDKNHRPEDGWFRTLAA